MRCLKRLHDADMLPYVTKVPFSEGRQHAMPEASAFCRYMLPYVTRVPFS